MSIKEENFTGKSTLGPSIVHFHTKCLDLNGGLTDVSPSEKLPLPITDVLEKGPNKAATTLSSIELSTSVIEEDDAVALAEGATDATEAIVFEEDDEEG